LALEAWKLKALGVIPPYFSRDEYLMAMEFFSADVSDKQFVTKKDLNSLLRQYFKDYELNAKELDAILAVVGEVIDKLEILGMIKVAGPVISVNDGLKIESLHSLFKFARQSVERMVRWTWFYLYTENNNPITANALSKLNPTIPKDSLEKTLQKVSKKCEANGLDIFEQNKSYLIEPSQEEKLVAKSLVDELELLSRSSSKDLEGTILASLDLFPQSNKELADRLNIDESTISRVLKRLSKRRLIQIAAPGDYGRQYWLTNCDNCPWAIEKEQCKLNSIMTLEHLFKQRFNLELDDDMSDELENLENQSLLHLIEIFTTIPKPSGIELRKRAALSRLFEKVSKNLSYHMTARENEFFYFDQKGKMKPLELPIPYLMGLHEGIEVGSKLISGLLDKVTTAKEAAKLRKDLLDQLDLKSKNG